MAKEKIIDGKTKNGKETSEILQPPKNSTKGSKRKRSKDIELPTAKRIALKTLHICLTCGEYEKEGTNAVLINHVCGEVKVNKVKECMNILSSLLPINAMSAGPPPMANLPPPPIPPPPIPPPPPPPPPPAMLIQTKKITGKTPQQLSQHEELIKVLEARKNLQKDGASSSSIRQCAKHVKATPAITKPVPKKLAKSVDLYDAMLKRAAAAAEIDNERQDDKENDTDDTWENNTEDTFKKDMDLMDVLKMRRARIAESSDESDDD